MVAVLVLVPNSIERSVMIEIDGMQNIKKIEQGTTDILGMLAQANQAEAEKLTREQSAKGADFLRNVIAERAKENPNVAIAPFIDPKVTDAAIRVTPIARDYVSLLKGLHDKNVGLLEPKSVTGGYVDLNAKTGQYQFHGTTSPGSTKPDEYSTFLKTFTSPDGTIDYAAADKAWYNRQQKLKSLGKAGEDNLNNPDEMVARTYQRLVASGKYANNPQDIIKDPEMVSALELFKKTQSMDPTKVIMAKILDDIMGGITDTGGTTDAGGGSTGKKKSGWKSE